MLMSAMVDQAVAARIRSSRERDLSVRYRLGEVSMNSKPKRFGIVYVKKAAGACLTKFRLSLIFNSVLRTFSDGSTRNGREKVGHIF